MQSQNLILAQDPLLSDLPGNANGKRTYVMQGNAQEKALDIYHLILAPSYACNLRCKHCYLPQHDEDLLPKAVALRLIDEWQEIVLRERGRYGGIFHVKGGEPFLVPYLWDIVDRLCELQSLRLMLTTNGTIYDDQTLAKLRDCHEALEGHVTIIVSLDGATNETNKILRGDGHYSRALQFLKGLSGHGINFHLNCVVHAKNLHELSPYLDLAKEYGTSQVNFLSFTPRGFGSQLRHLQIDDSIINENLEAIYHDSDNSTQEMLTGSLPYIKHNENLGYCKTSNECVATYRGLLYIIPNGYVFACPNVVFPEYHFGNIKNDKLNKIMINQYNIHKDLKDYENKYECAGNKVFFKTDLLQFNNNSHIIKATYGIYKHITNIGFSYCYSRNY